MFDFRRATVFCLGHRSYSTKWLDMLKIWRRHDPWFPLRLRLSI